MREGSEGVTGQPARGRRRLPSVVVAALAYLLAGALVLAPGIRPGQTVVAADLLYIIQPFSSLPDEGREYDNPLLSDAPFQFFPWMDFIGDSFHNRDLPEWNAQTMGGVPVTPNGFVSVYYPGFWLTAVMAPLDAYNLFVLLHLVLAALGTFVFARLHGARHLAAWLTGLFVFAAAFWVHWSTHLIHLVAMAWLPWALVATHLLVTGDRAPADQRTVGPHRDRPDGRRVAGLALVFGTWWLGANPQYAYYGTLTMGAYAAGLLAYRRFGQRRPVLRTALAYAAALALGLGLTAPVLLPTVKTADRIVRQREPGPSTEHAPKQQAIRALVPDAYGNPADGVYFEGRTNDELVMDSPFVGVTIVLLGAAAALGGRRHPLRLLLLAGLVGAVGLAYTGQPHRLLYQMVPGYDRFRGSARWLSIVPALAIPLAALGLSDLLTGQRRSRLAVSGAAAVAAAALAVWYAWVRGVPDAPLDYLRPRALFAAAVIVGVVAAAHLAARWPGVAVGVIAACAVAEIGFFTPRWFPEVDERTAFPDVAVARIARERGGKLIHVGDRTTFPPFAPNLAMAYGASDAQGLSVLFPADFDRFLRTIDDYGDYARLYNSPPPLSDGAMLTSPLLDVLDVRTVVAASDIAIPGRFPRLDAGEPNVYGRTTLGAASIVPVAEAVSEEEMWKRIAEPGWDPARTAAVLGLEGPVAGGPGTVVRTAGDNDHERWQVDAPAGGFLRVSGNWDEGWSARVDGRSTPVLRADGVFRGLVLPPGTHRVDFTYRNGPEHTGRLVAVASLTMLGLLLIPLPYRIPAVRFSVRRPKRLQNSQ